MATIMWGAAWQKSSHSIFLSSVIVEEFLVKGAGTQEVALLGRQSIVMASSSVVLEL